MIQEATLRYSLPIVSDNMAHGNKYSYRHSVVHNSLKNTASSQHNIVSTIFWVCIAHRALPGSSGTIIVNMTRYDIDELYF